MPCHPERSKCLRVSASICGVEGSLARPRGQRPDEGTSATIRGLPNLITESPLYPVNPRVLCV